MPPTVLDRVFPFRQAEHKATTPVSSLGRDMIRPHLPAIAICSFVFAVVFLLWRMGHFQFLELQAYDRFLKTHAPTSADASPAVIVGITEDDLQRLNTYPIPDDALSDALQKILAAQPAAVVVDLYRNLPVPGKDPNGLKRLEAVFAENPNVIAIQRLGLGNEPAVRPPPYLSQSPEQVGYNDFSILDRNIDDTVRRAALMMWEFGDVYYSDPLLAALLYLQSHGIPYDISGTTELRLGQASFPKFSANDGAYVDADAQGYQVLLNFRGPAKFRTYEFAEALSGKIPPNAIHGKVVFVGPLATSLKDYISTPLSKRYPGLLLHAQIVEQLVGGALTGAPSIRFWTEWQETLWLLLWCVIGTVVGSMARSPLVLVAAFLGCILALVGIFWMGMDSNFWLLLVAPAVGFTSAAAISTSHQAYLERRQRAVLMQLFAQHVSANIATDIWNHRDQFMDGHHPKPQVIPGTVIFTDLQGFTGTAEALPPEVLLDWLNEFMEAMTALIQKHGGMVNKYMGDAIMAVFGAPIPRVTEDEIRQDATSAVRSALAMAQQLDLLNESWNRRGLPTTMMRVGIASGPLVSGSIGGAGRLEYTVTGDTVVIAKRLESVEKESTTIDKASRSCRILITEETFTMLGPQFTTRLLGPMRLEGKNRNVGVYVLIDEKRNGIL